MPSTSCTIVLAQLNCHVGDIAHNLQQHERAIQTARDTLRADVIVFPELSLTGYPAEDLFLRDSFIAASLDALNVIEKLSQGIHVIVGHPMLSNTGLHNACSVFYNGECISHYSKQALPNYGVFDEKRYFKAGQTPLIVTIKQIPLGIMICEDLWEPEPIKKLHAQGAKAIISLNASPFEIHKVEKRRALLEKRIKDYELPICYLNNVGGQDDLVFDGGSFVMDSTATLVQQGAFFEEQLLPVKLQYQAAKVSIEKNTCTTPEPLTRIYQALVLGLKDYVVRNHFKSVILGLSGGIDSALTLAIAIDALGADKVHAVFLPSQYSAKISREDAEIMANLTHIAFQTIPIDAHVKSLLDTLAPTFAGTKQDVTEENLQARIRMVLLMALANKFGHLLLSTGNRSELAVGYCTLYGDMAGGFAPLKDVPKTLVYELAAYRNQISAIIPKRIIERAPSAELAPNQKDQDTLPPYDILDSIIECYLTENRSVDEIITAGFDATIVRKVVTMIQRNEYKRRQGAIGPRINHGAFGRDRRYPITNGFKE